jgi:ribosome biogenesis GTPase
MKEKYKKVSEIIDSAKGLDSGFKDIHELAKTCKFTNCTHTTEPECSVRKAISEGTLSIEQFNDYYATKKEAEYVSEKKNKTKAIDYMKKLKLFR